MHGQCMANALFLQREGRYAYGIVSCKHRCIRMERVRHKRKMIAMQRDQEEPQPQLLLTIRQVQKALKLSRSMVYLLIRRGELRAIHIGKAVRVKQSEIRRFVQACEAAEQTGRGTNKRQNTKKRE